MDDFDAALNVDVLAASLRMDGKQSANMLEFLAQKLELALPENVTVKRGGWLLSKDKPVEEILVRFEDFHYQLVKGKHGPVGAKQLKIVRGVALKTNDVTMDEWISLVAKELSDLAAQNAQARDALGKMVG
jgi:hypothetical protein